jgi:hypothetical protein
MTTRQFLSLLTLLLLGVVFVRPISPIFASGPRGDTGLQALSGATPVDTLSGADCGEQINNAYKLLPAGGGVILVRVSCSFSHPVNFTTYGKRPVMVCPPGGGVTLTYTGSGNGMTFDVGYGTGGEASGNPHRRAFGIEGCTIAGPGPNRGRGNSAVGVVLGGSKGAEGFSMDHTLITGFGTAMKVLNGTWNLAISDSQFIDNGKNYVFAAANNSGERMSFVNVTFASSFTPNPVSCVDLGEGVEGGFTDHYFVSSNFDDCGITLSFSKGTSNSVYCIGCHFENPGGKPYNMITLADNSANSLSVISSEFIEDADVNTGRLITGMGEGRISLRDIKVSRTTCGVNRHPCATVPYLAVAPSASMEVSGLVDQNNAIAAISPGTTGRLAESSNAKKGMPLSLFRSAKGEQDDLVQYQSQTGNGVAIDYNGNVRLGNARGVFFEMGVGNQGYLASGSNGSLDIREGSPNAGAGGFRVLNNAGNATILQTFEAGHVQMAGSVFTKLPPAAAGTLVWCRDCIVQKPCKAGGNGAWAFSYATGTGAYAWNCAF